MRLARAEQLPEGCLSSMSCCPLYHNVHHDMYLWCQVLSMSGAMRLPGGCHEVAMGLLWGCHEVAMGF
jgi:hypothetical protein